MEEPSYSRLIVWQKADELASRVYGLTANFPKSEIFGLVSQLRRAALSVPTNLVEGYARRNKKEFRRFVGISYGSLVEVEYLLSFAYKKGFLPKGEYEKVTDLRSEVGRIMWKFSESLK